MAGAVEAALLRIIEGGLGQGGSAAAQVGRLAGFKLGALHSTAGQHAAGTECRYRLQVVVPWPMEDATGTAQYAFVCHPVPCLSVCLQEYLDRLAAEGRYQRDVWLS